MKKFLLGLMFVTFIGSANAKNLGPRDTVDWSDELDLEGTQKIQVDEIKEQSHKKILAITKQIDVLRDEIVKIHEDDAQKVRLLLNEKQQIKFDKIQSRRKKMLGIKPKEGEKKPSRKRMRQF